MEVSYYRVLISRVECVSDDFSFSLSSFVTVRQQIELYIGIGSFRALPRDLYGW